MPGTSSTTRPITIRLPNEVIEKIEFAIDTPANRNASVNDFCKEVIIRYVYRHSIRKYRDKE